jgi:hypothetical protein
LRILHNEKGGLFVYALFLVFLLSLLTLPLLQISSSRDLTDIRDKNRKIATDLAVSAMEEYLAYLQACLNCTNPNYFREGFLPNGIKSSTDSGRINKITLPDGTPVTLSISYQHAGGQFYQIVTRVVAGDSDLNNEANESLAAMKEIAYRIDATLHQAKLIDPENRTTAPRNQIVLSQIDSNTRNRLPNHITVVEHDEIRAAISNYLADLSQEVSDRAAAYQSIAIPCTNCSIDKINKMINNGSSPVIIKVDHLTLNNGGTYQFGSSNKQVVLLFDSLTLSNNVNITMYGNLVVGNFIANNNFNFYSGLPNTNFWVTGTATFNNSTYINTNETFYAGTLISNNNTTLYSKNIIIKNSVSLNNTTKINAQIDMVIGNMTVNNNAEIECESGDLFVRDNLDANNKLDLQIGGSLAIGGKLTLNNKVTIETGGQSTSLHLEGNNNGGSWIDWNPVRN